MYVCSKDSFRKKVVAEEPLTRGELKVVGKLLDRLEKLEAVADALKHLRQNRSMSIDVLDWDGENYVDGIGFTFSDWEPLDNALAALEGEK